MTPFALNRCYKQFGDHILKALHAGTEDLDGKAVAKPVDGQAGKEITFTVYHAVCLRAGEQMFTQMRRGVKPFGKEFCVDRLFGAGEHAYGDEGRFVVHPHAKRILRSVLHGNNSTLIRHAFNTRDFVREHPRVTMDDAALFVFAQADNVGVCDG